MGMPGCGKSTLGKKLSSKLNLNFIDLDDFIENSVGKKISDIFEKGGEETFRSIETLTLKKICETNEPRVIALGGGTPCKKENLLLIKNNGISVYIRMPLEAILSRIKQNPFSRPMFAGINEMETREKLIFLIKEREPFYSSAEIITDGLDADVEKLKIQILSSKKIL
jgi:shikimate kinase